MTSRGKHLIELDGAAFDDFAGFCEEFSRKALGDPAAWRGNLDAFNDFLRPGMGIPSGGVVIRWKDSGRSRQILGAEAAIARLETLAGRAANAEAFRDEIALLRSGQGQTLFDELVEIIRIHGPGGEEAEDEVELLLE